MRGRLSIPQNDTRLSCATVGDFDGVAFGRRVASAREWAGLAPKQLAEQLGMSDETVYRLERGKRKRAPGKGELRLLAEALGQPEDWLLNGDVPPWLSAQNGRDEAADALSRHPELTAQARRLRAMLDSLLAGREADE